MFGAAGLLSLMLPVCAAMPGPASSIEVCFSPGEDCTDLIVREIGAAKKHVLVQAYVFTARPIADALLSARKRGVETRVILDQSNKTDRYSVINQLRRGGVEVYVDAKHAVANNKVVVIDDATVITGSFNFTKAADDANAENLLVIRGDAALARRYADNWETHVKHSDVLPKLAAAAGDAKGGAAGDSEASDSEIVYVTKGGKRYHRRECETLKGGGVEMTIAEAKKQGKTPCKVCKPRE